MANIKPFCAYRPKEEYADKVAALPYDVYNRKEACEEVKREPLSFLRIDRAETSFDDSVDTYADCVYEKARELLDNAISDGIFIKDEKPCFYLYELTMNGRSQTGLVCTASVFDYESGIIKKHENTRADKEIDRIKHVDRTDAQTGPIFLANRKDDELLKLYARIKCGIPVYSFTSSDAVTHKVWVIDDDKDIKYITDKLASMNSLYIADGHHRCASAAKVCKMRRDLYGDTDKDAEYNFFLSVIFNDSELMILDYNRVVKDLGGESFDSFFEKLSKVFEIREKENNDDKPSTKGEIFMLYKDKEYVLMVKPEFTSNDPIKGLDVSILQDNILGPVLGITDPKTDKRIDFVGGIRGVKELRRRIQTDCEIAFCMYPTSIDELFKVADEGLLMPPKSTWFEPKLRSGLFIHKLK